VKPLEKGDRVLVRNRSERGGTGKMRSYWEDEIHTIKETVHNSDVIYKVAPEKGPGRSRILHRNILMPCDALLDPISIPDSDTKATQKPKPIRSKQRHKPVLKEREEDESSSEEEEYSMTPVQLRSFMRQRVINDYDEEEENKAQEKIHFEIEADEEQRKELKNRKEECIDCVNKEPSDEEPRETNITDTKKEREIMRNDEEPKEDNRTERTDTKKETEIMRKVSNRTTSRNKENSMRQRKQGNLLTTSEGKKYPIRQRKEVYQGELAKRKRNELEHRKLVTKSSTKEHQKKRTEPPVRFIAEPLEWI